MKRKTYLAILIITVAIWSTVAYFIIKAWRKPNDEYSSIYNHSQIHAQDTTGVYFDRNGYGHIKP